MPLIRIQNPSRKKQIQTRPGQRLIEALIHHDIFLRSDCGGKGICGKCQVDLLQDRGRRETINACQYKVDTDIAIHIPDTSLLSVLHMDKAGVKLPERFTRGFTASKRGLGFAVDLGTTTIGIFLCDMGCGKVISSIALKNSQAIYGDDVMSRISAIGQTPKNLTRLQAMAVRHIQWGMETLLKNQGLEAANASKMVVVGNPAMVHIFAGIDPSSLGISPYEPAVYETRTYESADLGFKRPHFTVRTLPNVSGFIGGDTLAAALAVDFYHQPQGTLMIDLGTNGELLLKGKHRYFATSCATGPAFEGATISCGSQAVPGAVNGVFIGSDGVVSGFSTVTGKPGAPVSGICGAGIINAVAQFCDRQILRPDGAYASGEKSVTLVPGNRESEKIYISQKDIRSVQLGKSALMTGIELLLKKAGLDTLEKIILAGAFGSYLNKADLIRLGMIPALAPNRIEAAGNAAGAGAVMALCDNASLEESICLADRIKTVDLAGDPGFQDLFVKNLRFPEN